MGDPVAVIGFVFVTSWPLMALAEPHGSALVAPANYWWYFVVTAATVGYGDFFPETGFGHLVGAYVIVGGIATLTTVFTKLASVLEQARGRRMRGTIAVTASGHIVLLGYVPGRTERLVGQLLADDDCQVVLCAWDEVATHPMPEHGIDFVRGDLTDEETLRRAGVPIAAKVLVDGRDDNEALAITVTVHYLDPRVHLVVPLRDLERSTLLRRINENVRCVRWHTPRMITEELTSPGSPRCVRGADDPWRRQHLLDANFRVAGAGGRRSLPDRSRPRPRCDRARRPYRRPAAGQPAVAHRAAGGCRPLLRQSTTAHA